MGHIWAITWTHDHHINIICEWAANNSAHFELNWLVMVQHSQCSQQDAYKIKNMFSVCCCMHHHLLHMFIHSFVRWCVSFFLFCFCYAIQCSVYQPNDKVFECALFMFGFSISKLTGICLLRFHRNKTTESFTRWSLTFYRRHD